MFVQYTALLFYGANTENHPEEDAILKLPPPPEDIKRKMRVFQNGLENIPFHMTIYWGALVVLIAAIENNKGETETQALTVLFALYTTLRLLYAIFYVLALQPFRSIAFLLSTLCTFVTAIIMCNAAWQVDYDYPNPSR